MTRPMAARPVIGVDPSYTATAIAFADTWAIQPTSKTDDDVRRADIIAKAVRYEAPADALVVIEAPSHASRFNGARLGSLHGVIRHTLMLAGIEWLDVAPTQLKKYATGKGNVDKVAMVIAARDRLGYDGQDDNVADALWLRQIGLALTEQPCAEVPKVHWSVLDKLRPQPEGAA
ncbi:MAG: hypothetical protein AAGA17_00295 [Actinomycetota bacterium]